MGNLSTISRWRSNIPKELWRTLQELEWRDNEISGDEVEAESE